jgi:hypothetical protein
MPATSVRDLTIHQDDLVIGTHGRGFWILDDITPLRQLGGNNATQSAHLYQPEVAYRVRWNRYTDTPLPGDEPMGENPPDGAMVDYALSHSAQSVTLEVLDSVGHVVRRYANNDAPEPVDSDANIPLSWVRPGQMLSAAAGAHRFLWDTRYAPPDVLTHDYPIAAVPHNTPRSPRGPWALPGHYTVKLTVDGVPSTQPLTLRMDPRVHTPALGLRQQLTVSRELADALHRDWLALTQAKALGAAIADRKGRATGELATALASLGDKIGAFADGPGADNLATLNDQLAGVYAVIEGSDGTPTTHIVAAAGRSQAALTAALAHWTALKSALTAMDAKLTAQGLAPLSAH